MSNESRARTAARSFRSRHGLGDRPIHDLFELVHETMHVDVVSIEASESEHGLTMKDPQSGTVVICVATTDNPMRQRSSIAHELAHLVLDDLESEDTPIPGLRSRAEIQADAFARHLLLPLEALPRSTHPAHISIRDLSEVVQRFEVSPQLAAIQLREAGLITPSSCEEWARMSTASLATEFGWLSQYRALSDESRRARAPQRLMTRAVEGYRAGVLDITELAEWYGQPADQLVQDLDAPTDPRAPQDDDYWGDGGSLFPEQGKPGGAS